ncbi:MAG: hypothetical protein LBR74_08110 [Eubacterium sp.]|jgi:DNA-3-methyladenine glycosylase I|nr:hypothetical protein [Eubacterium sp.]
MHIETETKNYGAIRCQWGDTDDELMREYHDTQWGKPCFDELKLNEETWI